MTEMPDMLSPRHDSNPYTPLRVEIREQDRRPAQPWMAALWTLLTSGIVPFVTSVIVMIVSVGYQRAFGVFAVDFLMISLIYSLGWCLIPGLISAVLASQIARGRSTAREVLLFWGLIGISLLIVGIASATPVKQVNQLMALITVVGALFVFQAMITIFFGRFFRGTAEIESDESVSAFPEG